jgi:hypothetical protein
MDLQRYTGGRMLHFPPKEFRKMLEVYDSSSCRKEWNSRKELDSLVAKLDPDLGGKIVGHISADTAREWLDWKLGGLYVVGWNSCAVFCIEQGFVVVE